MAVITRRLRDLSDRQTTTLVVGLLLGFFAGAVTVSLVAYFKESPANLWQWVDGFAQNFGTEMFGAFLTFLLFDRLVGERQKKREAEERRKQDQANAIARLRQADTPEDRQAVLDEMKARDLFKEANLSEADLSRADLRKADLRGADLRGAKLDGANLSGANLFGAVLNGANLRGANLRYVNLRESFLGSTSLEGAKYVTCKELQYVSDLEGAILPDGTKLPSRTFQELRAGKPEPNWREAFEAWAKTVPVDDKGHIIVD